MLVRVLDHHDRRVNHGADRDCDAAKTHDVGTDAETFHGRERHEHAYGQHQDRHQGAADMEQENDANQSEDEAFLQKGMTEIVDRVVDQLRTVIDGLNGHTIGQAAGELRQALLTLLMTSSALAPKRCSTMPLATSPSPLSSVKPRRSSGPSSTRATSCSRTGVPPSFLSTILRRSGTPLR